MMSLLDIKRAILREKILWELQRHQEFISHWKAFSWKERHRADKKARHL